ncbi:MAG: PEP-CTERM sorting domain-containing protein [Planctomycetota bacterium]
MSDTDVFEVILLGDSFNEPIDPANPLTLDNFRAAIVIPEPASVALLLLAVLGSVKQRP